MSREQMVEAINSPSTGSIRRRWLQRRVAKVVVVGPDAPPTLPAPQTPAEIAASRQRASEIAEEHRKIVAAEIAALDQHAASIDAYLAKLGDSDQRGPSRVSYAHQEMRSERRQLKELRAMLEEDLAAGPPLLDLNGKPISDHARAYVRYRAREIRDSYWAAAEQHAAAGDHREARHARRDALRSRQIAEDEANWRGTIAGFGLSVWT